MYLFHVVLCTPLHLVPLLPLSPTYLYLHLLIHSYLYTCLLHSLSSFFFNLTYFSLTLFPITFIFIFALTYLSQILFSSHYSFVTCSSFLFLVPFHSLSQFNPVLLVSIFTLLFLLPSFLSPLSPTPPPFLIPPSTGDISTCHFCFPFNPFSITISCSFILTSYLHFRQYFFHLSLSLVCLHVFLPILVNVPSL